MTGEKSQVDLNLGLRRNSSNLRASAELKPGLFGLQVRPHNRSASPPPVVQVAAIHQLSSNSKHRVMV